MDNNGTYPCSEPHIPVYGEKERASIHRTIVESGYTESNDPDQKFLDYRGRDVKELFISQFGSDRAQLADELMRDLRPSSANKPKMACNRIINFANSPRGKRKWPELVGVKGEKAAEIIKKQNPYIIRTPLILPGSSITMDMRYDRVRVFVSDFGPFGTVIRTPVMG